MNMEEQADNNEQLLKTTTDLDQETLLARASVRPSTPDKCAVCLNNKQNDIIARIDSCSHTFCYSCILEWSKVRAICPLCKQPFSIITRERFSGDIVEEIRVQAPRRTPSRTFSNINDIFNWFDRRHAQNEISSNNNNNNNNNNNTNSRHSDIFRQMVYMEWLNTLQALVRRPNTHSRHSTRSSNASLSWSSLIPLGSIRQLLQRYLHQTTTDLQQTTISSQATRQTVAFRKYIYINRLFVASPLVGYSNDTLTVRECSPAWYASNPACLHRLIPFLARELLALLWNDERTIEHLISEIMATIQLHNIRSNTLARKLNGYLGRYTKHFTHEFYTFARCPYDLAGFDRHARYPTLNESTQLIPPMEISLDDDNGNEQTPIVLDETSDPSIDTIDIVSSPQEIATESESRSSSPECEIVEYVEPNSERSPNLIVLSEDEDNNDDDHDSDDDNDSDDLQVQILSSTKRKHPHDQQDRRSKKQQTATTIEIYSPTSVILDDDETEQNNSHQEQMQNNNQE